MAAILVVSSERYSGKSSLAIGLALELRDMGYKVGYMKPVGAYPVKVGADRVDEDAYFMREALKLEDDLGDISPYFLTWDNITRYMRKLPGDPAKKALEAYGRIADGKDLVIIEGAQNFVHGRILGLSAIELSELMEAGVLLLDTFNEELTVDRALSGKAFFGERFMGVVVNWVPQRRMEFCRNLLTRFLTSKGIDLFGAIPTDNVLRSITVGDMARALNGEVACAPDRAEELIESMMVGAMGQEQALRLFRKQANKVVITGGDRSDIQMAALETPTKALILTGGHRPSPLILGQSEEMGVPIILVDYDTATTVEMVEAAIGHQKVHSPAKIERMRGFVREGLNLELLLERVGVRAT